MDWAIPVGVGRMAPGSARHRSRSALHACTESRTVTGLRVGVGGRPRPLFVSSLMLTS